MEIDDIRGAIDESFLEEVPQGAAELRKVHLVDTIAMTICSSTCAARGVTPCWSPLTDRPDAMEWPNPFCDNPGCSTVAERIYQEIKGDLDND